MPPMVESFLAPAKFGNFTGDVNGYLTGCDPYPHRSFYRPMDTDPDTENVKLDLRRVLGRVEQRLVAVNLSADRASDRAKKPDAIRNMRRAVKEGRNGVNMGTLVALAPVLRSTASWLADGTGAEDLDAERPTIPVRGKAGAGGKIYNLLEGPGEIDRITPDPMIEVTATTSAVEIEGESLGENLEGMYAIYDEVRHPPTLDLLNVLCILETDDGRVYVKKLRKGKGKRFNLTSDFGPRIDNVKVKWAAPVRLFVRG